MFSHVLDTGTHVAVETLACRVVMRLTHLQRSYSLDITATAWGETLLGLPVNAASMTADLATIARWWAAVNDHDVSVRNGSYVVACPTTKRFQSRTVRLAGDIQERTHVRMLCCPECGGDVAIPDHELSLYANGNKMRVPAWKMREVMA